MICDECETVAHCLKNGCVPKHKALDRMAENARELGLMPLRGGDYEPAPVQEIAMAVSIRGWVASPWFARELEKGGVFNLYTASPNVATPLATQEKNSD